MEQSQREGGRRWVSGRDQPKNLYAYTRNPWTQTRAGESLGWEGGLEEVKGGKKGTYVIFSTIKILKREV